eukprot:jgi/Tetstr1/462654/TSEL_007637.t1
MQASADAVVMLEGKMDELERQGGGLGRSEDRVQQLGALLQEACQLCGPRHLVLARIHAALLMAGVAQLEAQDDPSPELAVRVEAALGAVHPDVGATCDTLASAMEFLLAAAPKRLFAACPQWPDFSKASKAQYAFLKRSKAIGKLYACQRR